MNKEILNIVNEILGDNGNAPIEKLEADMSLRKDIGFNSLDLAVLTARIEENYGVDIFADGIIDTVGEVLGKLE